MIQNLPINYSVARYEGKKYGITRTDFNNGKSIKIYAEELGGTDVISLNYYITTNKEILKPCEMPELKVIDFLNNYKLI
ncbi:MAG: peptide methionine sulfoxide reductase [Aquaticitalea sp.]